jgi:predicted O-methyltransferase YrrM
VAFGFEHRGLRIAPIQVRAEIGELLRILRDDPPRRVVEIGTAGGGTLFLLARTAAPDATLVSVDLGLWKGHRGSRRLLYRSFASRGQRVRLVRGDSHEAGTAAAVERALGGAADFLFVDGDHSYEGVRQDYETYSPLVRSGGLVALHDVVPGEPALVGGVPDFWQELRTSPGASEIVASPSQAGYGIGLIRKSE